MKISIHNKQRDLKISNALFKKIARTVITHENQVCNEVALHFVTGIAISKLHDDFFGDPTITDTISFPLDDQDEKHYRFLGDVFVCPKAAVLYAKKKKGGDAHRELVLYVIHGLLHLLGYDDMDPAARRAMRRAEKRHMHRLTNLGLLDRGA